MEFPKAIAKLESLHKKYKAMMFYCVNKSRYGVRNWFIRIHGLSRTSKVFMKVMNYTLIFYVGNFIIFEDDNILMLIKSLIIISKFKCKSKLFSFEIEYDKGDYVFQLCEKRYGIYEKRLKNELIIVTSLI